MILDINNVGSLIILGVLLLFLIVSPFIMRSKNKREMEAAQKMVDSIKKGDEVLTASGVIGKVVSVDNKNKFGYKTVTIETGDATHKGYFTLDAQAIYANLSNPGTEVVEQKTEEPKTETVEEVKTEEVKTEEVKTEEKVEEKPVENKKSTSKKKSTKKSK